MVKSNIAHSEYNHFRAYLERHSGIVLDDNKQYLVQSRLGRILKSNSMANLGLLVDELERNPRSPLKQVVIDAMTTNETSWFRDSHPYDTLKRHILASKPSQSRWRIWSAACSSGQEPYSISMVFDEWLQQAPSPKPSLEVLATDLSLGIISAAQSGCYDDLSIKRGLSEARRSAFFTHKADNCWQVNSLIQQRVRFQAQNLLESFNSLGTFDVVFCRNVLIYFSPEAKQDILRRIHQVLKPGGYLFLGGSEAFASTDLYVMEHCHPGIVYRAI